MWPTPHWQKICPLRPGEIKMMPVAIGARLKSRPEILTLGFKPNFSDYTPWEQKKLLGADKILFPTAFYADLFNTMDKPTFPSYHTYKFTLDKIKQTTAFQLHNLPHPRTRFFYGKRQKQKILDHFSFPFVAKIPRGSARGSGVFLIQTPEDLARYLNQQGPAYIQEYLPMDRDMRIIIIGKQVVLSYWRQSGRGDFRTNVSLGGDILFDTLPEPALELALETAEKCGWDDVGIDIIESRGKFHVLEGNMKYGIQGFKAAGMDYKQILCDLILEGRV